MRTSRASADAMRIIRAFAAGAGCGFVLGALVVALLVSHYGKALSEGTASLTHLPWTKTTTDDGGDAVIRAADGPVATSGRSGGTAAKAPNDAVVEAAPGAELADRDLAIPVEGVREDQLVRSFSENRGGRPHEAIDILAPRNAPVKAAENGKIARLFLSKAGGLTIYQFDPSERYCYYYAHLERYAEGLREGQEVRKGQVIGYVGTSGNAPKGTPHLHFAIFRLTADKRWWEGTPIDPYDVLK
jgi:peptidoglycan LD-endopeptidase LytH